MMRRFHHQKGFTLIEMVLTIVLLGFLSLILIPFIQSIAHSPDPVLRQRAVALGQALMDEILAKRWDENTPVGGGPICTGYESGTGESPSQAARASLIDDCITQATLPAALGPDGGETRSTYNDVDDYHDQINEVDTFTDQDGAPFTMTGYSRQVEVDYIPSNSDPIDAETVVAGETTDTKRIVVTVTSPLDETFTLVAVSCNF